MPVDCRIRKYDWEGIIIHHTDIGNRNPNKVSNKTWKKLFKNIARWLQTKDQYYVSAHYIIGRGGELEQLVDPDHYVAYHAGRSSFWLPKSRKWTKGMNDHMIGIELVGDGNKGDYSPQQYQALAKLCSDLVKKYHIQYNMIVGHEMVSPGRKVDPGKYFNWFHFFNLISKF